MTKSKSTYDKIRAVSGKFFDAEISHAQYKAALLRLITAASDKDLEEINEDFTTL